jgi:type IV pilus assembly protein PilM
MVRATAKLASGLRSQLAAMPFATALRAPLVGLDIGTSGVRAVALRRARSGWALTGAAEAPVVLDASAEGQPPDPIDLSSAVRQALDALRLRRARVAAALCGHVIVKRLALPAMSERELAAAIPWEAEQHIPFDLAEVQLDYQVLNAGTGTAASTFDILLVAAKKDRVEDRAAVIRQAGRQPAVMDVEAFALANAYRMNYPEQADPLTALLHVGRGTTVACLLERGQLAFTRDISLGGRLYAETLQRELGVDATTAERLQRGLRPSDASRDQAVRLMREVSSQLVLEIRKTVDFYRATAPVDRLRRIVLSGGACAAEGLVDLLAAEFEAPIETFDPFRRVARPKGPLATEPAGPAYAVAVGLALRREGDR